MADDIEEVKKIIAEKNLDAIPDVQKAIDEVQKVVTEEVKKLPNFNENEIKIIQARGGIIELSTLIESVFNEIILLTNEKDNLPKWRFKTKAKFIEDVMREIDLEEEYFTKEFLAKFEDYVDLRNIFAHVPTDKFSKDLRFTNSPLYGGFFVRNPLWKDVSLSAKEAISIGREILPSIVQLIKISYERAKFIQELMDIFIEKGDLDEKE